MAKYIVIPRIQLSFPATPSYEDDGTSYADQAAYDAAWASADTAKNRGNPTNDNIDINMVADNTNDAIAHDLGAGNVSDTKWMLRFKIRFSAFPSSDNVMMVGLFDSNQTVDANTAQDGIYSKFQFNSVLTQAYYANDTDGIAPQGAGNDAQQLLTWATATNYFVEFKRLSAISYTVELFTNSNYQSGSQGKLTGVCVATTQSLRYIKFMNIINSLANAWVGTIDDIQFWNDRSSPP